MRSFIDPFDFNVEETMEVLNLAQKIIANPKDYSEKCRGKILASLFFESSTRTRLSFESAMYRLGGNVIGFADASNSSTSKGESLGDTIKSVNKYSDIIAMRHSKEGSALVASRVTDIPVINAGDGGHQHPTQTLTDLLTIISKKGTLEGLKIGLVGDLKFGRTIHSLIKSLSRYPNNKFILVSPIELKIPEYITNELKEKNIEFIETEDLDLVKGEMDILYMTRVQRERFFNEDDYIRLKDTFILTKDKLESLKDDMIILHPLPRVNEIHKDVDKDKRAVYFDQVEYGRFVRMALILKLLEIE
ncbi:MAG: aspartate carbamoyltransferase [Lachnospirales bacterium]